LYRKLYAIAANTFVETVRQPIYGVLLGATLLLMIFNVALAGYTLGDDDKLLTELGLSTLLLSGLFLASFSATSVLTREIDNKTILTVVSKPVSRVVVIAGKYLGLLGALSLAFYLCFLGFLFSMQHRVLQTSAMEWHQPVLVFGVGGALLTCIVAGVRNYLSGKEFITTALALGTPLLTVGAVACAFLGRSWELQDASRGLPGTAIFAAAFLVFCAVMVLAAIALAASTRLGQVLTLVVCLGVLVCGLVTDYLLSELAGRSTIAGFFYSILPNFNFFWIVDAVNNDQPIPAIYPVFVVGYALLISTAALCLGVALFQRREIG
jgi:ABC-type transport system involved in multi-copper enzyme maturation permease subunit